MTTQPDDILFEKRISLKRGYPSTLAFGGQLKNTICLLIENQAFLTPIIADLEDSPSYDQFRTGINGILGRYGNTVQIVAFDLHPDYLSSKLALDLVAQNNHLTGEGVQHHHAHAVSVMAEHGIDGKVIAIVLDGTGYGTDGTLWGGEILVASPLTCRRAAWLKPVRLPGGARAIREPWRIGFSYLYETFGDGIRSLPIPLILRRNSQEINGLQTMMERRINSPLSSGCGRLFDGVAAITGVSERAAYEGEAAIALEQQMTSEPWSRDGDIYHFSCTPSQNGIVINPLPMIDALVRDVRAGVDASACSRRFHNGLIEALARTASAVATRESVDNVVLSGGCFLNLYLREGLVKELAAAGFNPLLPELLPPGDAGLSLGQAIAAASSHVNSVLSHHKESDAEIR